MSEHSLKCDNNAFCKQKYTLKLSVAFILAYSCCFGLRGNLDFPDFLQKSFITSTTGFDLKISIFMNRPSPASFCLFLFFLRQFYRIIIVDLSRT